MDKDKIKSSVSDLGRNFYYVADPNILFDHWSVMRQIDERYKGDCDDFALTAIWKACDEDLLTFVLNVFILHTCRIWFVTTKTGGRHAVGNIDGLYFDNWTREALPKEEFIKKTGHKFWFFWLSPLMIIPVVLGFLMRYYKR